MGAGGQVSPCNGFFRELAEYTNCLPDGGGLDQMSWDKKLLLVNVFCKEELSGVLSVF